MRLSVGIAAGVGLASAAQEVCSFTFVPLAKLSASRVVYVARHQTHSRVKRRAHAMSTEGGELDEAMRQVESTSINAILPPVATGGEVGGVLNDIASEVAGRAAKHNEEDDEDIVPMNAGIEPMAPGPIVAKPIQGMDADDVPGKIVVDPETLAEQQRGLEKIAQQLRRERLDQEAIDNVVFGFCPTAELWNGRSAMFGITVGMLTEYWTGQSFPQQVETMAQILGLLPLDYETYFQ